MIAEVIVDIKNKAVDRIFDYEVPLSLQDIIQPGVRVLVPFGPRTLMGIVLKVKATSELEKLRPLKEQLDVVPILNSELLKLGVDLAKETGATLIKCFEAMIPSAIRATYRKKVQALAPLPKELAVFFREAEVIDYEKIPVGSLKTLRESVLNHQAEIIYEVKDKLGKKTAKYIALTTRELDLDPFNRAKKQKEVLLQLLNSSKPLLKSELSVAGSILKPLKDKGLIEEIEVEVYRDPYADSDIAKTSALTLNLEQQRAVEAVKGAADGVYLLHGITGSGKTEVYLQMIEDVVARGKQAIMLVPEISLTPQIALRFKSRFGDKVAVIHSALSTGERYDEWRKILKGEVQIVVGARSAIFVPFKDIGIIIIDEEHEATYKQEVMPRYHAAEVAKTRAMTHQAPVVLGSATPSLESFARAQKGIYAYLPLTKRAVETATLPHIKLIDSRESAGLSESMLISAELQEAIQERLSKDEQTVLLLNRRGYSNFMQCRECGEVINCPHCDVSLTYHKSQHALKCHYCGFGRAVAKSCPACESHEVRFFGTGTQKIEEYLQGLFPEVGIIRMDVDTTAQKGAHQKLIEAFERKEAHILIGTQMVGKGLDFPDVTLVGVLAADLMLHLPDYKAAERTFQLLTQVSGRAGRHTRPGDVLIQTYSPDHYVMEHVKNQDYLGFYEHEMAVRRQFGYPPYFFLAAVFLSGEDYNELITACDQVNRYLRQYLGQNCLILGPTVPAVGRVNNRFRMEFMVKYKKEPNLRPVLSQLLTYFDQHPVSLSLDYYPNFG